MAKIWGQLENAQLENKSSDYTTGPVGRTWWNTTSGQVKVDDGTNVRALLRNDLKAIIGNSGTASQNIRFHRGASGVLQFAPGDNATSEGSLVTTLSQISGRAENYTSGTLPSAGNAGRVAWLTDTGDLQIDNGVSWQSSAGTLDSPLTAENYSIACSVGSNALTIALKDKSGSDASSGSPIRIGFRSSTITSGVYLQRSVTSSLSTVISSGSTAGHTSAVANNIHIYAIDNAGTVELAWSTTRQWDEYSVVTTTAEGGNADSGVLLYSTSARSNVPIRYLATITSNQSTAGTWASVPTIVSSHSSNRYVQNISEVQVITYNGYGSSSTRIFRFSTSVVNQGNAITYADSSTLGGSFTINEQGVYAMSFNHDYDSAGAMGISLDTTGPTTSIASIANAERIAYVVTGGANHHMSCATVKRLYPGQVIRAHGNNAGAGINAPNSMFRISKIAD